ALDFKDALVSQNSLTILLAVPSLRLGKPNALERIAGSPQPSAALSAGAEVEGQTDNPSAEEGQGDARYLVATQELEDENTGSDGQPIQVRFPNAKLLLDSQNQAGYAVLPLARVRRPAHAEGKPELDTDYIPPLLACEAWKPLQAGVLQVIYDRFGRKIAKLAAQVVTRGISFDTRNAG